MMKKIFNFLFNDMGTRDKIEVSLIPVIAQPKYKLSANSLKKLETCDFRLSEVIKEAIKYTPIDFGVSDGYRSLERQNKLFKEGKSKVDGINQKGKHNYSPSKAVDVYAYINGKPSWDKAHLSIIAGAILYVAAKKGIKIRWGGTFGSDNLKGWDLPHFEVS